MVARLRRVIAAAAAPALLLAGGCASGGEQATVVVTSTSYVPAESAAVGEQGSSPAPSASAADAASDAGDAQGVLEKAAGAATAAYGGSIGLATVGERGAITAGFTEASPAWSTIKVPIAIAALWADPSATGDAQLAITASDNAAAERLYAVAGPEAVNAVLAEAGLGAQVNTVKTRAEFSTFGQTQLGVADEAVLANRLACVTGAAPVIALMGQVDPSQSYGLGTLGAYFKGGWGPDEGGAYQVRQFGLVPRPEGGYAPVAVTALPADGTYETGQAMLNQAAQVLGAAAGTLPVAACQP